MPFEPFPMRCANCGQETMRPGQFLDPDTFVCSQECKSAMMDKQSYKDLADSGGVVENGQRWAPAGSVPSPFAKKESMLYEVCTYCQGKGGALPDGSACCKRLGVTETGVTARQLGRLVSLDTLRQEAGISAAEIRDRAKKKTEPQKMSSRDCPRYIVLRGASSSHCSTLAEALDCVAQCGGQIYEPLAATAAEIIAASCEHGVKDGDWCESCNKAMKAGRAEDE